MPFTVGVVLAGWAFALVALFVWWRRWALARRTRERVFEPTGPAAAPSLPDPEEQGWLTRWLFVAGYRGPGMAAGFVGATLLGLCLGAVLTFTLFALGVVDEAQKSLSGLPRILADLTT